MVRFCVFALLVSALARPAAAEVLIGEVVAVADGDTITVLDGERRTHRIRLQGIDAPERRQPFSRRSTDHLATLVFRKRVEVLWEKRDRYGRIVGKVLVAPEGCADCAASIDVGLAQVRSGLAWWYRRYADEQPEEDRAAYEAAELDARAQRRGLWADLAPVPPWEFRRSKRGGKDSEPGPGLRGPQRGADGERDVPAQGAGDRAVLLRFLGGLREGRGIEAGDLPAHLQLARLHAKRHRVEAHAAAHEEALGRVAPAG